MLIKKELEPLFLDFRDWWMQLTPLERAKYFNENRSLDKSIKEFKKFKNKN